MTIESNTYRRVATDAVIQTDNGIILLKRAYPPFEGRWVLPGGLVEAGETVIEACVREVNEEIGITVEIIEFVGYYDDPMRDERGLISLAFRCKPVDDALPVPKEEAVDVDIFDPYSLPSLGFDHEQIITDALSIS